MTYDQIASLSPGSEVLVRGTIVGPVGGNGDVTLSFALNERQRIPCSEIFGAAPERRLRVGDTIFAKLNGGGVGRLEAIFGDMAVVKFSGGSEFGWAPLADYRRATMAEVLRAGLSDTDANPTRH
jgi:hypothetical protein